MNKLTTHLILIQKLTPFCSLAEEVDELRVPVVDGLSHRVVHHLHIYVVGEEDVEERVAGSQRLPLTGHVLYKTLLQH